MTQSRYANLRMAGKAGDNVVNLEVFQVVMFRLLSQIVLLISLWTVAEGNPVEWKGSDWGAGIVSIVVFQFSAEYYRIYDVWVFSVLTRLRNITCAWGGTSIAVLLIYSFLISGENVLPPLLRVWVVLSWLLLSVLSVLQAIVFNLFRKRPRRWRKVAIVGASPLGYQLQNTFCKMPWLGYKLIGYYDDRRRDVSREQHIIGGINDVYRDTEKIFIDILYIALPSKAEHRYKNLLKKLEDTKVEVIIVPDSVVLHSLYYDAWLQSEAV